MPVDRHRPPLSVRVVELIHVSALRGGGESANDPVRTVEFYYEPATGNLLACHDPVNGPADSFMDPVTLLKVGQPVKYRLLGESPYRETVVAAVGAQTGIVTLETGDMVTPDKLDSLIPIDATTRLPL